MARIRTIKPEFFRHEELQDLERENPGAYVMLVFAGLWGHCDKGGVFEWKPRTLKLDILPFLDFDMAKTLTLLERAGFIQRFEVEGRCYGYAPKFAEHQRITGKEAEGDRKFPRPPEKQPHTPDAQQGSNGETTGKHPGAREGKGIGREEEGKGERARGVSPARDWRGFQDWRAAYPAGTFPAVAWQGAERHWQRLLDDGSTVEELLASAQAYATQQQVTGNAGTQWVKRPDKFLADGHWRGPFPLPVTKGEAAQNRNLSASKAWLESERAKDAAAG